VDTGIYQITNLQNGKCYVGSAVSFRKRWKEHLRQLSNGNHHSTVMQRAWNKYGEAAFEFKKLLVCAKEDLIWFEQRAIDALKPVYNICKVAGSVLGYRHTPEAKAAAAERARGNTNKLGRKESPEFCAKAKISRSMRKNNALSAETRARISEAHKGKSVPLELRAQISEKLKGRKQDPELVAKRTESCYREVVREDGTIEKVHFAKGVPRPAECVSKMRQALATLDAETVRKVRDLLALGRSCRSIHLELKISRSAVLKIRDGLSYTWVI